MKLIKCHVENYGKLNNKDFVFDTGLTSLCFDNGYGKSTLVSFIKAMLFGLRATRTNSKDFDDRRKYYPFSGGMFGGSLTVLHSGREYRIERYFDIKSDIKDTLTVYRGGVATEELGSDVGFTLLGLDQESFERALLMNASDRGYGSTDGISARLWGFDSDEGEGFAAAYGRLEAKRKQIKAQRGHNDELSRIDSHMLSLRQRAENTQKQAALLDGLYSQRDKLRAEIAELEEQKKSADESSLFEEKRRTYAYHTVKIKEKRDELAAIASAYPNGFLPMRHESDIKDALSRLEGRLGAKSISGMSEGKQQRHAELGIKFSDEGRAEGDLSALLSLVRKHREAAERRSEGEQTPRFFERFSGREPTDDQIALGKASAEKYEALTRDAAETIKSGKGSNAGSYMLIAAILFICAAAAMLFVSWIFSVTMGVAGVLMLISSFAMKSDKRNAKQLLEEAAACEEALKGILAPYGYNTAGHGACVFSFSALLEDYSAYKADLEALKDRSAEARIKDAELSVILLKAASLLADYSYPMCREAQELYSAAELMESEYKEYISLKNELAESSARLSEIDAEVRGLEARIRSLLSDYAAEPESRANGMAGKEGEGLPCSEEFSPEALRSATERCVLDRSHAELCKRELAALEAAAEEYRRGAGLEKLDLISAEEIIRKSTHKATSAVSAEYASGASISEPAPEAYSLLPQIREELARLEQRIGLIEAELEFAPEYESELCAAEEKREELVHEMKMLDAAMSALKEAEHTLSEKYISPVRDSFIGYASAVEESTGERYTMDKSFNIRFDEQGKSRDERHLSHGQHAIISLALKLSLADAMYGSDGFIILDDPFSSLDDSNLKKMQTLIKRAAKNRQIVYFTCHNSRKI